MKIRVMDIPEDGMQVNIDSNKDKWLKTMFIEVLGPENFKDGDGGRLSLQLFRNNKNVTVVGGLILQFHPSCDRCLNQFKKQEQVTIHQVMFPISEKKIPKKKEETVDVEDEDIGFYKGDEIELDTVVREGIILEQEMVSVCNQNCKGLCQTCGKNLNDGSCKCKKKNEVISPFAVFKGLKLKKVKKA